MNDEEYLKRAEIFHDKICKVYEGENMNIVLASAFATLRAIQDSEGWSMEQMIECYKRNSKLKDKI